MIHAYDEQYLDDAMHNLGEAFDFARNVCGIELDEFLSMMISSGIAGLFERGTPKTVSGMSGTEFAMEILRKTGMQTANTEVQTDYSCSPEYWTGWIVAYFQWYTGRSFRSIREVLSMQEVLRLYPVLHEVSEERAVDALNQVIARKNIPARLQFRRKNSGLTQRELSEQSGVNLRSIQQYERRSKDINRAAGSTLQALASVLSCRMDDLLEYDCRNPFFHGTELLKPGGRFRIIGIERLPDRLKKRLPAGSDLLVPVLFDQNRQIAGKERRFPVSVHQMVRRQPELSANRVPVVVGVSEFIEKRPGLHNVFLCAGGALIVWRHPRNGYS